MGSGKEEVVPEILAMDIICKRYGWTFDEFDEQFERHPRRFGELFHLLNAEAERMDKESRRKGSASEENAARKRRLGLN